MSCRTKRKARREENQTYSYAKAVRMASAGKRIGSLRCTSPTTAYWCAITVSLILLHQLRCTSASHPPGELKRDSVIVTKEYASTIISQDVAVQDSDASISTKKPKIERKEVGSMKGAVQLEENHGSTLIHPRRSWRASVRKAVYDPSLSIHRKWSSHFNQLHHPQVLHPGNEKIMLQETTATTTLPHLLQLLSKIWNEMLMVGSDDESLIMYPAAPPAHLQIRRRSRIRRKLPESSSARFPHTSNDFFSDYKDPQNHPPRSN